MGKLAIVFPGIGYTPDKPLLHYAGRLAGELGYEIRRISYTGFPNNILGDREKMAESYRLALSQTEAQLAGMDLSCCGDLLLIGKSIGTTLAARLAARHPSLRIRLVLYTPMEDAFRFPLENAIVFTGSGDPWVGGAESRIPALCGEKGIPCFMIPGANHALETGDILRDIQTLHGVMEETKRFLLDQAPEDDRGSGGKETP